MLKYALLLLAMPAFAADLDRDGIDDAVEQRILEQFAPTLRIAAGDCDVQPWEFASGVAVPTPAAQNGTIYGQVIPAGADVVEVHYYHLWTRDCGVASSHPLDAESVSGLLRRTGEGWIATHWFASAHEDTLCDVSNGSSATSVMAVRRGPDVWVSRGKHASFLSEALCEKSGCGKDQCDRSSPFLIARIVNIGERDAWMNGAEWAASPAWTLHSKTGLRFSETLLAKLDQTVEPALAASKSTAKGTQTTIKIAGSTFASLETANSNTSNSLKTATGATSRAIVRSKSATENALRRTFRFMGLSGKQ